MSIVPVLFWPGPTHETNTEWSIAYDQLGFERNTSSSLQSIDGRVGPGLASSYSAPIARPAGASSKRDSTKLRPELLYVPGQQARCQRTQSGYRTTFVFDNDYPALLPDTPTFEINLDGLLLAKGESGLVR